MKTILCFLIVDRFSVSRRFCALLFATIRVSEKVWFNVRFDKIVGHCRDDFTRATESNRQSTDGLSGLDIYVKLIYVDYLNFKYTAESVGINDGHSTYIFT